MLPIHQQDQLDFRDWSVRAFEGRPITDVLADRWFALVALTVALAYFGNLGFAALVVGPLLAVGITLVRVLLLPNPRRLPERNLPKP